MSTPASTATDEVVERFRPTNGRLTGILALVVCAGVAAGFVGSAPPHVAAPGVLACALAAGLVYAAGLRPRVSATRDELRMRTMFESVAIPLASIDLVVVRRYLLVRAGGTKYICAAISRSLRKTVRAEMKWQGGGQLLSPAARLGDQAAATEAAAAQHDLAYPDFVEQRIMALAADDRSRRGIEERSEEEYELGSEVRRHRSWPVIVASAVLAVAFVVSLLV